MIKQIFMITTGNPFFVDQSGVAEASQKAEHDLSEALNEGYTLFAHYPMQAAQVSGQIFILHKPDKRDLTLRTPMSPKEWNNTFDALLETWHQAKISIEYTNPATQEVERRAYLDLLKHTVYMESCPIPDDVVKAFRECEQENQSLRNSRFGGTPRIERETIEVDRLLHEAMEGVWASLDKHITKDDQAS